MVMEYESSHETVAHRFLQLTKPPKILRPHRPVVREGDASLLPRCELKELRHDEGFE